MYRDDDRFVQGAYITDGEHLFRVLRIEYVGAGPAGYRLWVEDCHGFWHEASGAYHFRQRWIGLAEVRRDFRLIKVAPIVELERELATA